MVGDVPVCDARVPGSARRREPRGVAGDDRAPQGHRCGPRRRTSGDSDRAGSRHRRSAGFRRDRPGPGRGGDAPAGETAPGRRLPLPGRTAARGGRRHPRWQRRRRPPRRRRRHRHPSTHLSEDHRQERGEPMSIHDDLPRHLVRAYSDTSDTRDELRRLRERLADAALAEGILDVASRTVDSPVGPLLLAATEHGLVRVAYLVEGHDAVLQALAERISPRILHAPARLDATALQLEDYFAGTRHTFDLPLYWRLSAGVRATVLHQLPDIGYGHTASYAAVAALAGNPKAVRAVGTACATNPLPVVVPCHRVIRSDGSMGGYLGGIEAKRTLLTLEDVA